MEKRIVTGSKIYKKSRRKNMESMYAEVVVKPKQPMVRNVIAAVIYVIAVAFFGFACYTSFVYQTLQVVAYCLPFEIVVFALNTYFYRRGKIEYEYLYCDDVLIVAKIINKSKRKNMAKIEMDNVELVAPITAPEARNFELLPKKDFASAKRKNPIYIMVTVIKGKKVRLLLEPSEKLLYCFRMKLGTRMVSAK